MRKKKSVFILIANCIFAMFLLSSCSLFPVPDRTSDPQITLPEAFSLAGGVSEPAQRWWKNFDSLQLNALINNALAENLTLRSYWARLERAQALAQKNGSNLFPSLSADGSGSYAKSGGTAESGSESKSFSLGLFASYEVDLWGRVRAQTQSAELSALASREDLSAAAMSIAAEVTRTWIGIHARRQELRLLEQQLETNQTYLELVELRFRKSLASALDVMQQKQLVERINARIPLAEMDERILLNQLAVLTGRLPRQLKELDQQQLPEITSLPESGVPAGLLANRPDIRAALLRLEASDQDLLVAKADRLPAIRLTGSGGYNSSELDTLFDNWLLNLVASLTGPLFDGGRRKAEASVAVASVNEQLALYRQEVLTAVQEVEDSLVREEKLREHISSTEKQLQAAQTALEEARSRYLNGLNDYLPVLTQLLSVQNLQMDLIARHEDLLNARITLYRAIGGTWTADLPTPSSESSKQQEG